MVLLIGNHPADQQQSMEKFAIMMQKGLAAAGVTAEIVMPEPCFSRITFGGQFIRKWLTYLDKFVLFPFLLRRKISPAVSLVHVCDHSNAMYAAHARGRPVVVTCHDLLAVRGALGEETDCPASVTGRLLQHWIVSGLRRATALACVSRATLEDAVRLIRPQKGKPQLHLVPNGLNYPYEPIPRETASARLAKIPALRNGRRFVLHVGSNLRRKNREGVLRIFARCKDNWDGLLVLAGARLSPALRSLGTELGISDRIVEVPNAGNEILEALYNSAVALLFPSSFEGFGWPIVEAQACGCPVLCADREPMKEVAGEGAIRHAIEDEAGLAADIVALTNPEERARWSKKALENAKRFSTSAMISNYLELYRSLGWAA